MIPLTESLGFWTGENMSVPELEKEWFQDFEVAHRAEILMLLRKEHEEQYWEIAAEVYALHKEFLKAKSDSVRDGTNY